MYYPPNASPPNNPHPQPVHERFAEWLKSLPMVAKVLLCIALSLCTLCVCMLTTARNTTTQDIPLSIPTIAVTDTPEQDTPTAQPGPMTKNIAVSTTTDTSTGSNNTNTWSPPIYPTEAPIPAQASVNHNIGVTSTQPIPRPQTPDTGSNPGQHAAQPGPPPTPTNTPVPAPQPATAQPTTSTTPTTLAPTPTDTPITVPTPPPAVQPTNPPTSPPAPSSGALVYNPPADFCTTHACVTTFWKATSGYVVQCANGKYSHSGGVSGACSRDGGVVATLHQ